MPAPQDPSTPGAAPQSPRLRAWLGALAVGALTVVAFLPATANEFISCDDGDMVWDNPDVLQGAGWSGLKWAFTTRYFGMWHPLTWLSHQVDASLFGARAGGHHLTSVLLHALAAVVFFDFLRRSTGALARSAVASLLFALHPLRVESVAWVAERKDVLCVLCSMGALWLYRWYRQSPSAGRWLAVTAAVAAAMLSKPMAVTLPVLLLLLDLWPLGPPGSWRARVLEKLPWLAMAAATALVTIDYQRGGGAVQPLSLGDHLQLATAAYGLNLWHTVVPWDLSFLYPRRVPAPGWVLASGAALGALAAAAWLGRRRWPSFAVGVAWFLGVTFPTVGLISVGSQLTADRYTYLPHAGLFAGLVFALPPIASARRRALLAAAVGAVLLALVSADWRELASWHDSETVYLKALARDPATPLALKSLAALYAQNGRREEALVVFRQALAVEPGDARARSMYARQLLAAGQAEAALAEGARASREKPDDARVAHNHAAVLLGLARWDEARAVLEPFAAHPPADLAIEDVLGAALAFGGHPDEAFAVFDRGLARRPSGLEVVSVAADVALRLGQLERARVYAAEVRRRAPGSSLDAELSARLRQAGGPGQP